MLLEIWIASLIMIEILVAHKHNLQQHYVDSFTVNVSVITSFLGFFFKGAWVNAQLTLRQQQTMSYSYQAVSSGLDFYHWQSNPVNTDTEGVTESVYNSEVSVSSKCP